MKFFSRNELVGILIILLIISVITGANMSVALRRARDAQRRADLGSISNALHTYYQEFGFFPPSEEGYVKACPGPNYSEVMEELEGLDEFDSELFFSAFEKCEWGHDPFPDPLDADKKYLATLFSDPSLDEGYQYFYISNTRRFQVYSALEGGEEEQGYDFGILERNLPCGTMICSYGKAFGETPLDRSIEDYEDELREIMENEKN